MLIYSTCLILFSLLLWTYYVQCAIFSTWGKCNSFLCWLNLCYWDCLLESSLHVYQGHLLERSHSSLVVEYVLCRWKVSDSIPDVSGHRCYSLSHLGRSQHVTCWRNHCWSEYPTVAKLATYVLWKSSPCLDCFFLFHPWSTCSSPLLGERDALGNHVCCPAFLKAIQKDIWADVTAQSVPVPW